VTHGADHFDLLAERKERNEAKVARPAHFDGRQAAVAIVANALIVFPENAVGTALLVLVSAKNKEHGVACNILR